MDSLSSAIKIENVWKVFGNTSREAMDAIQNQRISKNEALENCFNSMYLPYDSSNSDINSMYRSLARDYHQPRYRCVHPPLLPSGVACSGHPDSIAKYFGHQ